MDASEPSLAKKRIARDLRIIVIVQVVALGVFGVGTFLFGSNCVPNHPEWDVIHSFCGVLALAGAITFFVAAFWGFDKITNGGFPLPTLIRAYFWGVGGILVGFIFVVFLPCEPPFYFTILLCIFPFYCIIPQFFIARWLAKEGTMEPDVNDPE